MATPDNATDRIALTAGSGPLTRHPSLEACPNTWHWDGEPQRGCPISC
jgi:hypothetical protein